MDNLPLETLQRIFELACTDGGYTGTSLSLVSKGIRAAARATRFHSISLIASPHRLQLFVALYERECAPALGDRPRIRHLHVAFPVVEFPAGPGYTTIDGAAASWPLVHTRSLEPAPSPLAKGNAYYPGGILVPGPYQPPQREVRPSIWKKSSLAISRYCAAAMQKLTSQIRRTSRRGHQATSSHHSNISAANHLGPTTYEDYLSEAQTLFQLITPDLVTLVVQCGFSGGGDLDLPIIERPLPNLLEATFVGMADPLLLVPDTDGTTAAPLFPALTHLHLIPPFSGSSWPYGIYLPFWFTHAPCVTHLGVSCADDNLTAIAGAVGVRVKRDTHHYSMWALSDDPSDPSVPSASIRAPGMPAYPSVRHLLVQPGPGPIGSMCCCGNGWEGYDNRMGVLREIERRCEAVGVAVVEAKTPEDGLFMRHYEPARRRWLERMNDGRDEAGGWAGSGKTVSRRGSRSSDLEETSSPSSSNALEAPSC
ncbi:uncharacterized protein TRAVEDRAFT_42972 [Trametes versicolor FP-101664 SS1]|uniref:uncharacterized protein n=1 Tax=Trametes versicolor (strain FP-101664) TaxID=717944 RepID=UPI0004621AB6|nr:uncharacterized protein TRAVEDRAFT_42972 [Trametes versicolor FP-101664 SS1]EIW62628.1 hypothetical protein TRAVEDRAFT_42972 [Trametes versicolor FP-101664 SS1]